MALVCISLKVFSRCTKPCDRTTHETRAFACSAITELNDKGISSGRGGKMKIRSRLGGAPGDDAALGKAGSSSKCEILISSFFSPPSPHIYTYRLHSSSAHCPPTKKPSSNKLFHISFDYIKPLQGSLSLHALLTLSSFCSVSSFLCTIPTTHSLTDVPHCDTRPPLPIFSLHMCWCQEFCVCVFAESQPGTYNSNTM